MVLFSWCLKQDVGKFSSNHNHPGPFSAETETTSFDLRLEPLNITGIATTESVPPTSSSLEIKVLEFR